MVALTASGWGDSITHELQIYSFGRHHERATIHEKERERIGKRIGCVRTASYTDRRIELGYRRARRDPAAGSKADGMAISDLGAPTLTRG